MYEMDITKNKSNKKKYNFQIQVQCSVLVYAVLDGQMGGGLWPMTLRDAVM